MTNKTGFDVATSHVTIGKDTTFAVALKHGGIFVTSIYLTARVNQSGVVTVIVTDQQGNELLVDEQEL